VLLQNLDLVEKVGNVNDAARANEVDAAFSKDTGGYDWVSKSPVASPSGSLTQDMDIEGGLLSVHRLLDTVKALACALLLIERERLDVCPALC
jgi:hypothetical protein